MAIPSIFVARQGDQSTIKVVGKGTYLNAALVKTYADTAVGEGVASFTIDLQECPHMDSTFMGVLAGLARKQRERHGPIPRVIHLTPRTSALLATLGLDRILDLEAPSPEPSSPFTPLNTPPTADKDSTARTMLEAHRHLVESNPNNAAKFQDVIQYLESRSGQGPG